MVEKYPILEHTAFLLIGYVGLILLVEMSALYAFHTHIHFGPVGKFSGVLIIIALSIWYARSAPMRQVCRPVFRIANVPMVLYAKVSSMLIGWLLWPFKKLLGR